MESEQILNYLIRVYNSNQSPEDINNLEKELREKKLSHPAINYQIAILQYHQGNEIVATIKLKKILLDEIQNNFPTYNTIFSDSIAMSAFSLIRFYYKDFLEDFDYFDLFRLSYYYFTSHIKTNGYNMYDSLSDRGILCDENNRLIQTISNNATDSLSVNPIPQTLSDYYYASLALEEAGRYEQAEKNSLRSKVLYNFLLDMKIQGKLGNQYSISEMAEIGKKRNENIANKILIKDINIVELKNIIMQ